METIIPALYYTFTPSTNTITLLPPYNTFTLSQIKHISNPTKAILIFDSEDPRHRCAPANVTGMDISLTAGVITYVATESMEKNGI